MVIAGEIGTKWGSCGKNRNKINPCTLLCHNRNECLIISPLVNFPKSNFFPTANIFPTKAANYFPKKHFFPAATISQRAVNYFPKKHYYSNLWGNPCVEQWQPQDTRDTISPWDIIFHCCSVTSASIGWLERIITKSKNFACGATRNSSTRLAVY